MDFPKSLTYGYRRYFCLKLDSDPDFAEIPFDENEGLWREAEFTETFVDIEGVNKPAPWYDTKVKMRWSEQGLYFLAIMQGNEVWANVKRRDEVIFQDNDFEIFLDPDDDTHNYIELEINAINTVWDLLLTKPYRISGLPLNSFDIKRLETKTFVTENERGEVQDWRTVIFWPFESIMEVNGRKKQIPELGDYYRINFSRVHWNTQVLDGKYEKLRGNDGRLLPEENWVWSEQGLINMHYPEKWGFLYFCDENSFARIKSESDEFFNSDLFRIKSFLWELWYCCHDYKEKKSRYPDKEELFDSSCYLAGRIKNLENGCSSCKEICSDLRITVFADSFFVSYKDEKFDITIDKDGLFSLSWRNVSFGA